jgi:branched-chain amino acid aminotransferase
MSGVTANLGATANDTIPAGPERTVYLNGGWVPESKAVVSIFDAGFTMGDAAFDTMRTFNGKIFRLAEHVDRLFRSCRYIGISPGVPKEQMIELTKELVERNKSLPGPFEDYWVTIRITRGIQPPSHRPEGGTKPTIIIACMPLPWLSRAPYFATGVPLVTSPIRRVPSQCLDPRAKVQNYLNLTMADLVAREGRQDAWSLILDLEGNVAEAYGANFFIVLNGGVVGPLSDSALEGISRQTVIDVCRSLSIPITLKDFGLYDVYNADEAFISATSFCILPVRSVDGRAIGESVPGEVVKALWSEWSKLVGVDIVEQYLARTRMDSREFVGNG